MKYRSTTFLTQGRVGYREINKMPQTIALAILGAGAAGTAAAAALTFVIGFGISLAVSWAISALTPQPRAPSRKLMANIRDAAAAQEYVYGKVRKGGVVTYVASSGGDSGHRNLYMIIVLAGHPVEEIGDVYVNDGKVTLNSDGEVQEERWASDKGLPRIRIFKFDGTQTTGPDFPDLPANFVGQGIAYLAVRLRATNSNTWRNGIPLFTAEVKGKKVFDPRTGLTAWSDNAALCIRDYLVDERGMDDAGNIDEVTFSAAADVCDARGFKMNGVVNAENPTGNILQDMVTSCAGTLFWGGGKWRLKAGDYTFPVKTFTLDDLRSGITVQTRNSMRDSFNVVQGLFNDADQRWIEASYPEFSEQAFLNEDNNVRTPLNFNLPLVTNVDQARLLAAITLRRAREQITFSAEFGLEALEVEPGDIVNLDMSRYGWNNKEFEVIDWRLAPSSEAGDLRVAMTLREISEAAFDPTIPAAQIISNNSNLPFNFDTVDPISNLQAVNQGFIAADGTFVNNVLVTWTVNVEDYVFEFIVEWRKVGEQDFTSSTTSERSFTINGLENDTEYEIRVTPRNTLGTLGNPLSITFTTSVDLTPPGLPSDLVAVGAFRAINLSWVNPADADFDFVEIWESSSDNLANALLIATSSGSTFYRGNLDVNITRYYWIRAVDFSGNKSDFVGPVEATTTFLDDPDFEGGIRKLFEDAGLSAPEIVSSLPTTGNFAGRIVFLTTDNKLYRHTGSPLDASGWSRSFDGADIVDGTIVASDKIFANTITGGLLATAGIITNSAQIEDALITNAKIQNLAVNTIKVADGSITVTRATSTNNTSSSTSWTTLASITFTPTNPSGQIGVWGRCRGRAVGIGSGETAQPSQPEFGIRIRWRGSTISSTNRIEGPILTSNLQSWQTVGLEIAADTLGSGSGTVELQVRRFSGDITMQDATLICSELKK